MSLHGHGVTDIGLHRPRNEDAILVRNDLGVYAVCDGMGGYRGGDVASRLATEALARSFERDADLLEEARRGGGPVSPVLELIRRAIARANLAVWEYAIAEANRIGMGTTATVLVDVGSYVAVGHVGDSQAIRIRGDRAETLTRDHTITQELLDSGTIDGEEALHSRFRHVLTRSVGHHLDLEPDLLARRVEEGDRYVLCTDGLSRYLRDRRRLPPLATGGTDAAARRLVDFANAQGGSDNVSVVVLQNRAGDAWRANSMDSGARQAYG